MVLQAIAKYGRGKARTVSHVFVRIDVVLLAYRRMDHEDSAFSKASGTMEDVSFLSMINEVMPGFVKTNSEERFCAAVDDSHDPSISTYTQASCIAEKWWWTLSQQPTVLEECVRYLLGLVYVTI